MIFVFFLTLVFVRPFISYAYTEASTLFIALLLTVSLPIIYSKRAELRKFTRLTVPVSLFIGAIIASCLVAQDKTNGLMESTRYTVGLLLFFMALVLSDKEKAALTSTLLAAGVVISALALYQYAFGFRNLETYCAAHQIEDEFVKNYIAKKRVFLPFFGPNMLAGYLAMVAPLSLLRKKSRWLLLPIAVALFLTQSIGAFASIIAAAIFVFLLAKMPKMEPAQAEARDSLKATCQATERSPAVFVPDGHIHPRLIPIHNLFFIRPRGMKKIILLLALALGLGAILWLRFGDQATFRQPGFSLEMRSQYWSHTLSLIKQHPFKGTGMGSFEIPQARHAHNVFLELWTECGIAGIISFLLLLGCLLRSGAKKIKTGNAPPLLAAVFFGVLVFIFHNLVDTTFFFPETASLWWLMAGLLASLSFCRDTG